MKKEKKIIKLYKSGLSCDKIAELLGYKSHVTILNILKKNNIIRRKPKDYLINSERARKYAFNNKFLDIINEQQAYFLGLMFSDGWVTSSGCFGIALKDKELLEKVNVILNSTYPINKKINKNGKEIFELRLHSKKMVEKLSQLGCILNKSKVLLFPTWINENIIHHFIRGYFDGDGGIRITKQNDPTVNFCGTLDICKNLRLFFNEKIGSRANVHKHTSIYRLQYTGRNIVKNLKDIIYKDATIFMERKRNIFNEIY